MDRVNQDIEARAKSEAGFHDARINIPDESRLGYAYASVADVYEFGQVPLECMDRSILELGCFRGDHATALSGFTGRYTGIDISPAAIDYCSRLGLPSSFEFRIDDANTLATIEDGSVDYAFGSGVLHHLELARFAPALARKMSARGFARFVEPAQGNFLLRTFRKLTPKLRTPDEYPFDAAAIAVLEKYFDVRITYKALVRPYAPMIFLNSQAVVRASRWVDERLLRLKFLQSQAWLLQIEISSKR